MRSNDTVALPTISHTDDGDCLSGANHRNWVVTVGASKQQVRYLAVSQCGPEAALLSFWRLLINPRQARDAVIKWLQGSPRDSDLDAKFSARQLLREDRDAR